MSLGALRHYFSTQHELLDFAMNLVKERVTVRCIDIMQQELPPREKVSKVLLELLPTDEGSMAEMEIWLAFTFHLKTPGASGTELGDGIHPLAIRLIEYLDANALLKENLDKELEAERLYAILDGLALHALLEPKRLDRERIIRVLEGHLDSICI